ncbi:MAG: Putative oxidoreductase, partial [uncultured Rubrobacteraceae bacterium]
DRSERPAGRGGGRDIRTRWRPARQPSGLRRHAHYRRRHLGGAGRSRGGPRRTQAGGRARHKPHRHRRLLWPGGLGAPYRGDAPPVPRWAGYRYQGRSAAGRAGAVAARRQARAPARGVRGELEAAEAGSHRPLSAAPHRPAGSRRGVARDPGRVARRGEDPARRSIGGGRRGDPAGAGDRADSLGPEPLQPHGSRLRRRARLLRARGDRLYPLVPPGHRGPRPPRRPARRDRRPLRCDLRPDRVSLASVALPGDAPHPGYLLGRAPGGKRRRCIPRTGRGGAGRARL